MEVWATVIVEKPSAHLFFLVHCFKSRTSRVLVTLTMRCVEKTFVAWGSGEWNCHFLGWERWEEEAEAGVARSSVLNMLSLRTHLETQDLPICKNTFIMNLLVLFSNLVISVACYWNYINITKRNIKAKRVRSGTRLLKSRGIDTHCFQVTFFSFKSKGNWKSQVMIYRCSFCNKVISEYQVNPYSKILTLHQKINQRTQLFL